MKQATKWMAEVASVVFEGTYEETGEPKDELSFFVIVENERGDRYASHARFDTTKLSHDECERRAIALCERVEAALAKGADPTMSSKWSRTRPCYGSEAYADYGQAEDRMWELKEAEVDTGERLLDPTDCLPRYGDR